MRPLARRKRASAAARRHLARVEERVSAAEVADERRRLSRVLASLTREYEALGAIEASEARALLGRVARAAGEPADHESWEDTEVDLEDRFIRTVPGGHFSRHDLAVSALDLHEHSVRLHWSSNRRRPSIRKLRLLDGEDEFLLVSLVATDAGRVNYGSARFLPPLSSTAREAELRYGRERLVIPL